MGNSLLNRVNNSCNFYPITLFFFKIRWLLRTWYGKRKLRRKLRRITISIFFLFFFFCFLLKLIYLFRPSTSVETSFTCNPGTVDCISNCLAANTGTDAREVCYNINFLSLILRGDAILRISPVSPSMCKHTMGTSWLNILRSLRSRKV